LHRNSKSFFLAVGFALSHHNSATAPIAANIREIIAQFISDNASDNFPVLDDHSFKFCVRRDYIDSHPPCVIDFAGGHQASPTSFREWMHAMLQDDTFPDSIFIKATTLCFDVQIVFINDDSECCTIGPSTAFRRIFIRVSHALYFSWCHPDSEVCVDDSICSVSPLFSINSSFPALAAIHSGCSPPPAFAEAVLTQRHQLWLTQAHCAHTGHPGVEATIRILKTLQHEWRGITKDTAAFIRRCPTCLLNTIRHNPALSSSQSLRTTDRPLAKWHIDQTY
jgi:hypothetical protein